MTAPDPDPRHSLRLTGALRQHAARVPTHPAVVCGDHRAGYGELAGRVDRLATVLARAGVGPGARVLWHGHNCHRVLECLLACARIGAIFAPLNWRWGSDEVAWAVEDAAPQVVVWQREGLGSASLPARSAVGDARPTWICHDDPGDYEARLRDAASWPAADAAPAFDPLLMLYTAAFEGRPNGALLPHTGLALQAAVMGMLEDASPGYRYLNCGPLFHIATFTMTLATLGAGGTNVFVPKVEAEQVCQVVERERCTGAYILRPTAEEIAGLNARGRYDLTSLRVRTGIPDFDAMTAVETSRWSARPGGYGQTEAGGLLTYRALGPPPMGSHGWPSPLAHLRIVDPEGHDVEPGAVGEIVARSPAVMIGYWNRPERSAARGAGGWHHTGDLGRFERDGSLTFIGSLQRIVKSASENIYPAEVEACLTTHPAVAEAAVIGVPDPVWTQHVKAVVVAVAGIRVDEHDLIEHCRARLASYKKPRSVVFVDALPRRDGRVDYDRLDALHGGGGYPGAASARYPT